MADYKGPQWLKYKLRMKQNRVKLRYNYYEMKNFARDLNISTPEGLEWLKSCLGWCGTAVDSLADRIVFREFRNDNFDMNQIFNMNNPDVLSSSAIMGALISSCDFIYISVDESGFPRMQVIDGGNATGIMDPTTMLLYEGYAVLERDAENDQPTLEAYFLPERTDYYRKGVLFKQYFHNAPYPLLVPIVFKPDAKRPFGHSRISRSNMNLMSSALRTIKRSEIAAEFFSFPQKYVTGLSQDAERMDKWKATMSAMMTFSKDKNGDHPVVGQFTQQSMEPHLNQLKMFASLFAGQNGLTLDDMGFPSANPSSSEAIRAAHENLRLTAKKAQKTFGTGFLNAGYLAACVRDEYAYRREAVYLTKPAWEPIFAPDGSALAGLGDAIIKINQALPGYMTEEKISDLLGI